MKPSAHICSALADYMPRLTYSPEKLCLERFCHLGQVEGKLNYFPRSREAKAPSLGHLMNRSQNNISFPNFFAGPFTRDVCCVGDGKGGRTEGKGKPRCLHFAPSSKLDSGVRGFGHDLSSDRLLQSPPMG